MVYDIAGRSYLIMRAGDDTIKAYPNACLHRGRQLKEYDGNCSEIRCPFHGFAWDLDGGLKDVPAAWDFPHVTAERFALARGQGGHMGRLRVHQPRPGRGPLDDFVEDLAAHFDRWDLRDRYVEAHVSKVIARELEDHPGGVLRGVPRQRHAPADPAVHRRHQHPGRRLGELQRVITPAATPSPLIDWTPDEEKILRYDARRPRRRGAVHHREGRRDGPVGVAAATRDGGDPSSGACRRMVRRRDDRQPRLHPVPELPSLGRVQPHRLPIPAERRRSPHVDHGGAVPLAVQGRAAATRTGAQLAVDEPWTDAAELGMLGKVFDQDTFNMARVQSGLETTLKPGVTLANYQESKVRWLHRGWTNVVDGARLT